MPPSMALLMRKMLPLPMPVRLAMRVPMAMLLPVLMLGQGL